VIFLVLQISFGIQINPRNPNKYSLLIIDDKISNTNELFLSTKFLEINPNLNVILLNNSKNIKYNYKFNILKKNILIFKLIDTVNELFCSTHEIKILL
jgi:hypothetical protein